MKGINLSVYLWASNLCHVFWSDWFPQDAEFEVFPLHHHAFTGKTPHWIVPHYPNSTAIWPTLHPTRHHFHRAPNGLLLQISPGFHQQPSAEAVGKGDDWQLSTFQPFNLQKIQSFFTQSIFRILCVTMPKKNRGFPRKKWGFISTYATQYSLPDDLCFPCTYSQVQSTETLLILQTFVLGWLMGKLGPFSTPRSPIFWRVTNSKKNGKPKLETSSIWCLLKKSSKKKYKPSWTLRQLFELHMSFLHPKDLPQLPQLPQLLAIHVRPWQHTFRRLHITHVGSLASAAS